VIEFLGSAKNPGAGEFDRALLRHLILALAGHN